MSHSFDLNKLTTPAAKSVSFWIASQGLVKDVDYKFVYGNNLLTRSQTREIVFFDKDVAIMFALRFE